MKRLSAFIACLAALFAWAPAQAQELKFATQNPKGHPLVAGMERFAEIVTARSGGKIKVNLFPGGVLGGDQANVSALQGGTLEMVVLNSGILASQVKEFGVYDFPFMFANPKEADAVVDGPFGKMMHDRLEAKGIVGLAYWELGFRDITNSRRPINKFEDIAGLKLRVIPNAINVEWVKALSANKLYEVQKHIVLSNHQYNPQSLIFSKKVWDTLSAADRKLLIDAGVEAGKYQRQVSRDAATTALENLKKNGMQVTELSAAELAKFREAMKPVIAKHSEIVGFETVAALQTELAKLRRQ